jgi:hypothetical protein
MPQTRAATLPSLSANGVVPPHVVYRTFPGETVMLNLDSGTYHGLNPTGGRMLEAVEGSPSLGDAAERLAGEYRQPLSDIQSDLREFCGGLAERGLLVLDDGESA